MAEETLPKPRLARERGYAVATTAYEGVPQDDGEQAPELQWPASVAVYDRMRRSDAKIASALLAVDLSMNRLRWRLNDKGVDERVARLVSENLDVPLLGDDEERKPKRRRGRFSFPEHRRMANLRLPFGHMFFEQVYWLTDAEGKVIDSRADRERLLRSGDLFAQIRKLAPRMPLSISAINVARDGGLESIEQYTPTAAHLAQPGETIEIGVDRLVAYTHQREGGNWAGRSVLRSIYKNWLLKDRLLRTDTLAVERNGMGVPWIQAPEGATQDDIDAYAAMAASFRAGEEAGGAAPAGTDLKLVGVSGQLPNALDRVRYHDTQIAQGLYTQFLDLGVGSETGSRALGESFIEFFLSAVDSIASDLIDTMNKHVIEDLVDINFGVDEPVPELMASPAKERRSLAATELIALAQSGLIREYDPELDAYIRDRYGLPRGNPSGEPLPVNQPQPRDLRNTGGDAPEGRQDSEEAGQDSSAEQDE